MTDSVFGFPKRKVGYLEKPTKHVIEIHIHIHINQDPSCFLNKKLGIIEPSSDFSVNISEMTMTWWPEVAGRCANRICKGDTFSTFFFGKSKEGKFERGELIEIMVFGCFWPICPYFAVASLHLKPMCLALTWSEIANEIV